jgi:hypothetical protein
MTVRVVRLLIYETDTKAQMDKWLANSLPEDQPRTVEFGDGTKATVKAYTLNSDAYTRMADAIAMTEDAFNQLVWQSPRLAPKDPA